MNTEKFDFIIFLLGFLSGIACGMILTLYIGTDISKDRYHENVKHLEVKNNDCIQWWSRNGSSGLICGE